MWDVAERLARKLETPEPVRDAYNAALAQATDGELAELIGGIWQRRDDRYSEIRNQHTKGLPKAEMSYLGG